MHDLSAVSTLKLDVTTHPTVMRFAESRSSGSYYICTGSAKLQTHVFGSNLCVLFPDTLRVIPRYPRDILFFQSS